MINKPILFLLHANSILLDTQEAKTVLHADDTNMLVTDNNLQ